MKNGKYTQFLIDLVVLFLSVKTPTIPNSIISKSRTSDKGKNEFLKFCFWHSKPSL
jgi:hypothetical protein